MWLLQVSSPFHTGKDTVSLNGDYSGGVVFNATTMVNVELIQLGAGHNYNLTLGNEANPSGLMVDASALFCAPGLVPLKDNLFAQ